MFPVVGKRGEKRTSLWKERSANEWIDHGHDSTPIFRGNDATRRLVDPTAARLSRIIDVHCVFNLGCVSGRSLFFRQLRLAFLFAGTVWCFTAQLVWTKTKSVARLVNFFRLRF